MTRTFDPWRSSCRGGLLIVPRIRPLLIESEGPDSGCFAFAIAFHRMNTFSTTGNLLFGNLQHHVGQRLGTSSCFRRGRTKLLSGSPAPTRGGQSRPHRCRSIRSRFGVHPSARSDYAKAISNSARRGPFPLPLCACGATIALPTVASPPQSRFSSFSDCATPVADKSAWRKHRDRPETSWPGITSCAIVAVLAG